MFYNIYDDPEFFNYGGATMKRTENIIKCECGYEYDPFASELIDDAWVDKKYVAHFEHRCPKCNKTNISGCKWN